MVEASLALTNTRPPPTRAGAESRGDAAGGPTPFAVALADAEGAPPSETDDAAASDGDDAGKADREPDTAISRSPEDSSTPSPAPGADLAAWIAALRVTPAAATPTAGTAWETVMTETASITSTAGLASLDPASPGAVASALAGEAALGQSPAAESLPQPPDGAVHRQSTDEVGYGASSPDLPPAASRPMSMSAGSRSDGAVTAAAVSAEASALQAPAVTNRERATDRSSREAIAGTAIAKGRLRAESSAATATPLAADRADASPTANVPADGSSAALRADDTGLAVPNLRSATTAAPGPYQPAASVATPQAAFSRGDGQPLVPAFTAQISPPLDSPAFAPALGVQVSMLVRNGIGEARLNLNPAELGPIAVRIELDGRQAQVLMTADLAQTRSVLEQALPALASAMSDAGFTLSGGGVSQQTTQQQTGQPGADRGPAGSRGGGSAAPEPAIAAAAPVRSRGLVDLVA